MKVLAFLFSALAFAQSSHAASVKINVDTTGIIKFSQRSTVTCMAIGCPPSLPYFIVSLVGSDIQPGQEADIESIKSPVGTSIKPDCIDFKGVCLREGMKVRVLGEGNLLTNVNFKYISSVQSVEVLSSPALEETILNCSRPSDNPSGPIKGYVLNLQRKIDQDGIESFEAILYPNCPACSVKPNYIQFDSHRWEGTLSIYDGKEATLTLAMESLIPTKTHGAILLTKSDGKKFGYSCEQP